jgi:hypothetical protein
MFVSALGLSMKPILLLDVDGVLNPISFSSTDSFDWKFEAPFRSSEESGGWTLNLSKEMGQAIQSLDCEIRWLTTWILDADFANAEIGSALGWERLALCPFVKHKSDPWWKPRAVKDLLQHPGPKVVWADDDINIFLQFFEDDELDPHNRLLAICPDPTVGLTKDDIDTIKEFLRE